MLMSVVSFVFMFVFVSMFVLVVLNTNDTTDINTSIFVCWSRQCSCSCFWSCSCFQACFFFTQHVCAVFWLSCSCSPSQIIARSRIVVLVSARLFVLESSVIIEFRFRFLSRSYKSSFFNGAFYLPRLFRSCIKMRSKNGLSSGSSFQHSFMRFTMSGLICESPRCGR